MIRIIVKETDHRLAVHIDGEQTYTKLKSFDIDLPELEVFLRKKNRVWREISNWN